ncbi:Ras family GTPase [Legionella steigerwaltii]|uniref:Ras family GTPase n=1 Tax=Legionella steigerwaltii TaxID=460 RepID=A0A378LBX9_9GAMM|nr:Rab family GTPase [Legionella steigerwaltii]KTD79589.1 Ras family GTPase [Legionella steigerwaltii]STY24525.1 Ras family GTPase [Legionella steigerwaltii]
MKTKFGLFDTDIELKEVRIKLPSFKVIFVGDVCGKTSLLKTFTSGRYPTNVKATIGVDFYHKLIEVNESKINLHIWDIPGVARYGHSCRFYFKETDIAIIGFDLARPITFDGAMKWLEEINQHLDRNSLGKIILVGLKSDAEPDQELDIKVLNSFVKDNNLFYMTASAKTGKNMEELFQQAVTSKMESSPPEEEKHRVEEYQSNKGCIIF